MPLTPKDLQQMRSARRKAQMAHEKEVGRPSSQSWGGSPTKTQKQDFRKKARRQGKIGLKMGSFEDTLDSLLHSITENEGGESAPFNSKTANRVIPQIVKNKKNAQQPISAQPWPGVWLPTYAINKKTLDAILLFAAQPEKYRELDWLWSYDIAPTRNRERVAYAINADGIEWSLNPNDRTWIGYREKAEGPEGEDGDGDESKQWLRELIEMINSLEKEGIVSYSRATYFAPGYFTLTSKNRQSTSMLFSNKLGKGFYIIKNKITLDWSLSSHKDYPSKPQSREGMDWADAWEEFAADPVVVDPDANESKLKRKILLWRDYLQFTGQGIYINRSTKEEDIKLFATKEDDDALKASLEKAIKSEISADMFEQKLTKALTGSD